MWLVIRGCGAGICFPAKVLSQSSGVKVDRILELLRQRKSVNPFGYGLGTAENHVKRFLGSAGPGDLTAFGIADEKSGVAAVKRAERQLTFCDPSMVAEKLATSVGDIRQLVPDTVKLPEKTLLVMEHVLTTDREDRDGDILRTSGAKLDPKAPLLWQHMHSMPIGGVVSEVSHTDNELKVASVLLDMNAVTHDAATLVEAGMLRFSHGFRVLDFEELKEKGESMYPGFDIKSFEIMEASLVSVPSNVDAEIEFIAGKKFESDFFKSIQKSVVADRPVTVPVPQMSFKFGDVEVEIKSPGATNPIEAPEVDPVDEKSIEVDEVPEVPEVADVPEEKAPEADEVIVDVAERTFSKEDAVQFLLSCDDRKSLEILRDLAAGQIELLERKAIAVEMKTLVGTL